jgi:hypothetical protein
MDATPQFILKLQKFFHSVCYLEMSADMLWFLGRGRFVCMKPLRPAAFPNRILEETKAQIWMQRQFLFHQSQRAC